MKKETKSLDVLKNIHFALKNYKSKYILFSFSQISGEINNFFFELRSELQRYFGLKIALVFVKNHCSELCSFEVKISNLRNAYDHIFIIQDIKHNIQNTELPECPIDGAFVLFVKKNHYSSNGLEKDQFVTNQLVDANIPILGLIALHCAFKKGFYES